MKMQSRSRADQARESTSWVSAGSARSLLLTVLGDFVIPDGRPVWTSTLVHVLVGVGVEERSARQAIARAASAGWIESERSGRRARWRLTPGGQRYIEEGAERVRSTSAPVAWDGKWLVIVTS